MAAECKMQGVLSPCIDMCHVNVFLGEESQIEQL